MNRKRVEQTRSINDAVLPAAFFQRPAAKVARDLLGKNLVRARGAAVISSLIVETEAYEGEHDLASHFARGRTRRTELLFGPAGRLYYRIYGLHWMLNVVTGNAGEAAAVLIRGIKGVTGPGRVAAALGIDASLHGCEAVPASGLCKAVALVNRSGEIDTSNGGTMAFFAAGDQSANETKGARVFPLRPRPTISEACAELTCDQRPVHTLGQRRK